MLTGGTATLEDCAVQDNTAEKHGGGAYTNGALTLLRTTISGNTASDVRPPQAHLSRALRHRPFSPLPCSLPRTHPIRTAAGFS